MLESTCYKAIRALIIMSIFILHSPEYQSTWNISGRVNVDSKEFPYKKSLVSPENKQFLSLNYIIKKGL